MKPERKADKTIKGYSEGVRKFLTWSESRGTAPELTASTVEAFIADLLDHGAKPSTALARQNALRRLPSGCDARVRSLPTRSWA